MARLKGADEWSPLETTRHARAARQENGSREAFVASREMAPEGCHRFLDTLGGRFQFVSKSCQSIAAEVPFDELVAHTFFELRNATLDRGLIYAKNLCGGLHAAHARERQEISEVIPRERPHRGSMQFCDPLSQSFDSHRFAVIGMVSARP